MLVSVLVTITTVAPRAVKRRTAISAMTSAVPSSAARRVRSRFIIAPSPRQIEVARSYFERDGVIGDLPGALTRAARIAEQQCVRAAQRGGGHLNARRDLDLANAKQIGIEL